MKKVAWFIFGFLCLTVGLYPLIYVILGNSFFLDNNAGLLSTKPMEVLNSVLWNIGFYGHIIFGGIALLIGWLQFSKKLRLKNINLHKRIGKIYMISVLISGVSAIYISFFATGGIVSILGFMSLGIFWLSTSILAYKAVKNGDIQKHQNLMIYSYAACFAAVTLRFWLPALAFSMGDFDTAYRIVAWLAWVPNIIVAYFIVRRNRLIAI